MATPSTQWEERIAPDEAERHAGYVCVFEQIQAVKSAKYGKGRALRRKQPPAGGGLKSVGQSPCYCQ